MLLNYGKSVFCWGYACFEEWLRIFIDLNQLQLRFWEAMGSRKERTSSRDRRARTSSSSSRTRRARTSSTSSRNRKTRTSSSSSKNRKTRTSSSSSSGNRKAKASLRSRSPKVKQKAFLDSWHHRMRYL